MTKRTAIAAFLFLYFLSLTWLFAGLPVVFNSPDESANFLFADEWRTDGDFVINEPLNGDVQGVIHPRSMSVDGERLLPKSFLGLPALAGSVGVVLGRTAMFFLTPALAVLAVIAWEAIVYGIFRRRDISLLAAFLLAVHPGFWYYSGRVMMHNTGFVAFLIFSAWAVAKGVRGKGHSHIMFVFAGVFAGIAIAFRASEIVWLVPLAGVLFFWLREQVSWKMMTAFILGAVVALLPFAAMNDALYGAPWKTGYQMVAPDASEQITSAVGDDAIPVVAEVPRDNVFRTFLSIFLPFGFAERAILRHVWQYGFALYPWMTIFMIAGATSLFVKTDKKDEKRAHWVQLLGVTLVLAAWLGVVYGSWVFHDNPDPNVYSLGNSYVRYWIPLFILASPFAALGIVRAVELLPKKWLRQDALILVCAVILILSARLVWFGQDGFVHTRAAILSFEEKRDVIVASTEEDAVVVVDRADKFLYPHRRVVVPLRSETTYAAMPTLLESAPLYYFGITLPEEDVAHLNDALLAEYGLRIKFVETVRDESLYRIVWRVE